MFEHEKIRSFSVKVFLLYLLPSLRSHNTKSGIQMYKFNHARLAKALYSGLQ
jgi:hypothetical protein